jgi:hypothetical protein
MSELIRIELTGKHADICNRVFQTVTNVIEQAVNNLMPDADAETKDRAKQLTADLAEITKDWLQAKLQRPTLENERTIAEIAAKYEELKTSEAQRRKVEVETEIKVVELEERRLALWDHRLSVALKWLGFLQNHVVRGEDGSVCLVLTNRDLAQLLSEARSVNITQLNSLDPELLPP